MSTLRTINGKQTPEYRTWKRIKTRCYNPNMWSFRYYGGRGIIVCERWKDCYENFLQDMGPRPSTKHSIDRIDNNGNYEPANCRWGIQLEQMNNTSRNKFITAFGKTLTISQWSALMPCDMRMIWRRLRAGWSPEDAVSLPYGARGRVPSIRLGKFALIEGCKAMAKQT